METCINLSISWKFSQICTVDGKLLLSHDNSLQSSSVSTPVSHLYQTLQVFTPLHTLM